MIKKMLFDGRVLMGVSVISDGSMRFFGEGEESDIIKNQEKLGGIVGLSGSRIARIRTIYDGRNEFTNYQEITEKNISDFAIEKSEKEIPVTDGLVTKCFDVGILLPLADCLGIVVYDEKRKIVGLLHAGRHNVEQLGPKKFVDNLVNNHNCEAKDLKVFYSPYSVDYEITKNNKKMGEFATEQLLNAGVLIDNITDLKIDTVSNEIYPSHSNGDTKNRFAIIVRMID